MKVVRYTFDVCIRDSVDRDTYSMKSLIEKAITNCDGVCGCETVQKPKELNYNSVDVNKAIEWQRSNNCWIGEKKGGDHA